MEETQRNDLASFQKFLDNVCQSFTDTADERDVLPIKIFNHHCLFEELEGEIIDWCLHYLDSRNCPPTLTSALCRSVVEEVLHSDLSQYEEESGKSQDEDEGEQENNKDNCQTLIEDESKDIVFDTESLCAYTLEVLERICKKWKENLPKISVPKKVHETFLHEIKNTRRKMEDRHVILPDLNTLFNLKLTDNKLQSANTVPQASVSVSHVKDFVASFLEPTQMQTPGVQHWHTATWPDQPPQSYYAVFDGHAGVDAAVYASSQLHCRLVRCESFSSSPEDALKCAYKVTDEKFISKAQRERLKSGSTGVSVLIRNDNLHLAWLGDSQAALVRNGEAVNLMDPHKPEREDEKARIEALGGCVMFMGAWRVNGNLAVSRAIGDVSHKKFITSDADVNTVKLDGTEDYIVLACDGLWDMLEPTELPSLIYTHLQETKGDRSGVSRYLVSLARDRGSSDNITVIIVFLRDDIAPPQTVTQTFNFGQSEPQDPSNVERENGQFGSSSGADIEGKGDQSKLNGGDLSGSKSNGSVEDKVITKEEKLRRCHNRADQSNKNLCLSDNLEVVVDDDDLNIQRVHLENLGNFSLPKDYPLRKKEQIFILPDPRDEVDRLELPKLQDELRSVSVPASLSNKDKVSQRGSLTAYNIPEEYRQEIQSWSHREFLEPLKEVNRNKAKRKQKKTKKDRSNKDSTLNILRKVSKKHSQLDPVILSFTGKSRVPIPNYKLNMAAKSFNTPGRVALATMYPNTNLDHHHNQSTSLTSLTSDAYLLEKLVNSKNRQMAQDLKNIENMPVLPHPPLTTFTVSSNSSKTTSTSTTNLPSVSNKTKEWELLKANSQFRPSWRPRRQTRPPGGVLSELPPTPLCLEKITPPLTEDQDD